MSGDDEFFEGRARDALHHAVDGADLFAAARERAVDAAEEFGLRLAGAVEHGVPWTRLLATGRQIDLDEQRMADLLRLAARVLGDPSVEPRSVRQVTARHQAGLLPADLLPDRLLRLDWGVVCEPDDQDVRCAGSDTMTLGGCSTGELYVELRHGRLPDDVVRDVAARVRHDQPVLIYDGDGGLTHFDGPKPHPMPTWEGLLRTTPPHRQPDRLGLEGPAAHQPPNAAERAFGVTSTGAAAGWTARLHRPGPAPHPAPRPPRPAPPDPDLGLDL